MINFKEVAEATGSLKNVIVSAKLFDMVIAELSDDAKEKIKEEFGDTPSVVPLELTEPEDEGMQWSMYNEQHDTDSEGNDGNAIDGFYETDEETFAAKYHDLDTDAPDGVYTVIYKHLGKVGEGVGVTVKDGKFNEKLTLNAVNEARKDAGYGNGYFLEGLEFKAGKEGTDYQKNHFEAYIGS